MPASKFRAFHVNWGNALDQQEQSVLTIHTDGWVPAQVKLASDGSVTHLGVTRDCNVEDTVQFYDLYAKTSVALTKLKQANLSVAAKLTILKTVIYPRIRYIGKAVCWRLKATQASYAQFDSLVFAAVRRITQNRPSYPAALIESPTALGGLGIPRVSVDCQLAKVCRYAACNTENRASQENNANTGQQCLQSNQSTSNSTTSQRQGLCHVVVLQCSRVLAVSRAHDNCKPTDRKKKGKSVYSAASTTIPCYVGCITKSAVFTEHSNASGALSRRRQSVS